VPATPQAEEVGRLRDLLGDFGAEAEWPEGEGQEE